MDEIVKLGKNDKKNEGFLTVCFCCNKTTPLTPCIFLLAVQTTNTTRPKTVFEVVADLWNSPDFNPVAPASDCHIDFHTATICSHEQVAALSPATPQRIEDIFTSMRSDLLRIITRWEQSGQGEGGYDGEEEQEAQQERALSPADANDDDDDTDLQHHSAERRNIGSLDRRPARALQTRAAFLNGRPSYVLYFWEVADSHQLLNSSLQRLSSSTGASDASCAVSTALSTSSAGSHRRKHRQQDDSPDYDESVLRPLVQSIQELAQCQRQLVVDRSDDRRHERRLQQRAHESTERGLLRERRFRWKAELSDLARKYRKLNAELDPSTDERSAWLSEFYINEGRIIEDEIRQLEQQHQEPHQQQPYEQSSSSDSS